MTRKYEWICTFAGSWTIAVTVVLTACLFAVGWNDLGIIAALTVASMVYMAMFTHNEMEEE
jgi:hypothetical protein